MAATPQRADGRSGVAVATPPTHYGGMPSTPGEIYYGGMPGTPGEASLFYHISMCALKKRLDVESVTVRQHAHGPHACMQEPLPSRPRLHPQRCRPRRRHYRLALRLVAL